MRTKYFSIIQEIPRDLEALCQESGVEIKHIYYVTER